MPKELHDLKFVETSAMDVVQMEGVTLNSPACQKRLSVFQENMRLVLGLAAIPGWTSMIALQWNMAVNNAAIDVWGVDFAEKMEGAPPEEVIKFTQGQHAQMGAIVAAMNPLVRHHLEVNTRNIEAIAMRCGEFVHGMFEGSLTGC